MTVCSTSANVESCNCPSCDEGPHRVFAINEDNPLGCREAPSDWTTPICPGVPSAPSAFFGIGYCDDYLVMQFGKTLSENNEQRANGVSLYSYDGTFVDGFVYEEPIHLIKAEGDTFYVVTESKVVMYKGKSREWFADTHMNIEDFYQVEKQKFIAVTGQGYELLEIRER